MPGAARRLRAGRGDGRGRGSLSAAPDRVPDPIAARALLWAALALVPWIGIAAPRGRIDFEPVASAAGCRLGRAGSGPTCACAELAAPTRLALGLPVSLVELGENDFEALAGIGPARAAAMQAERLRGGPFRSAEDLARRVPGIGRVTAARIAAQLAGQPGAACDTHSR